jgi:hypothetical protein
MLNVTVENIPWQKELEGLQEEFEQIQLLDYFEIKKELDSFKVGLDSDPSSVGVGRLNEKIARVDSYMSRTTTILLNAIKNENVFDSLFKDVQSLFDKHLRVQLRQKEITDLGNQNLRQAAAEEKITDIGNFKSVVEKALNEAKTHTKICREKLDNLDVTNKNISRQITVIQTQIEIGEIQRKVSRSNTNF